MVSVMPKKQNRAGTAHKVAKFVSPALKKLGKRITDKFKACLRVSEICGEQRMDGIREGH